MKRKWRGICSILLTLCMVFTMLPGAALAAENIDIDATNFPDDKFRNWILDSSNLNGKGEDGKLTAAEIALVTSLDVSWKLIESLEGIEHFTALTTLNCSQNWLTALPAALPAGLTTLNCSNNELTALPALPIGLRVLDCSQTTLTALPTLPSGLTELYCNNNQLTELPALPISLTDLNCSANKLTALDLSGLGSLGYCNAISQEVSLTLRGSGTSYTKTIALNNPTGLTSGLSYAEGELTSNSTAITTSSFTVATGKDNKELSGTLNLNYETDGTSLTFSDSAAYDIPASTVNSAITNIDTSPGVSGGTMPYTFSATGLPAGITISTEGVISGTPTTAAEAGTAIITVTDSTTATDSITINYGAVSAEPAGTDITDEFTDLNFRAAVRAALGKGASDPILNTNVASVTSLDVSSKNIASLAGIVYFTSLTDLDCYNNQLTELDLSSNTALTELDLSSNQLTELDLSSNTALTELNLSSNQLTALDLSSNTALTELNLSGNQFTALPTLPSGLTGLYCTGNQLSVLPTLPSGLTKLYCNNNQLTELPALPSSLTEIECNGNQLSALPALPSALTSIQCYDNRLTALPALPTGLEDLRCSDNQLTALDLSGLGSLGYCEANNQTASHTLTGNGDSYIKTISLNNPTNLISGLSYAGGVLTSNSTAITTSSFTVATGKDGHELSGTLNLTYQPGTNITLNANGGNDIAPGMLSTGADGKLTSLPTPARSDYRFDGWFTAVSGGTQITTDYVFTANTTIYAHWTHTGSSGGRGRGGTTTQPTVPAADGAVKINYTASNGTAALSLPTAKVDDIITKSTDGAAVIDLSKVSGVTAASLPKAAISAINEAGLDVTVKLPAGTITLDVDSADSILEQATGSNLSIELQPVGTGSLTPAQQEAVQSGDIVLDINILSGSQQISSFDGTLSVQVPYNGPQPVAVWYLNDKGDLEKIDCTFEDGIVSFDLDHLSLYVVGQDSKEADKEPGWKNPFTDVREADWFYGAVQYVNEKGLMAGTGNTTFSPQDNTTRGMIVTILYRLEGTPTVSTANPFSDIAAGQYYADAVVWAAENQIVKGYGDGKFGPNDSITREQMAVIMMKYAQTKGYEVSARADLGKYSDERAISGWAKEALSWANNAGLIQGDGSKLTPGRAAQRCQVASMLQKFIENIVK